MSKIYDACEKCGNKLAPESTVCEACGWEVPVESEISSDVKTNEAPVVEAPVEGTPLMEAPIDEAPVNEVPVIEVPVVEVAQQEQKGVDLNQKLKSVPEAPKKKKKAIFIVAGVVVVLALIIAAGCIILNRSNIKAKELSGDWVGTFAYTSITNYTGSDKEAIDKIINVKHELGLKIALKSNGTGEINLSGIGNLGAITDVKYSNGKLSFKLSEGKDYAKFSGTVSKLKAKYSLKGKLSGKIDEGTEKADFAGSWDVSMN